MKLKIKNESPHYGWQFFFQSPSGHTFKVVSPTSLEDLEVRARGQMANFKMEAPDNLLEIIEHQICLRQPEPLKECWSGGFGDDIHFIFMSPALKRVAKALESVATVRPQKAGKRTGRIAAAVAKVAKGAAGVVRRIASCGGCSGSRTFKQGANNLGRAGTVNKLTGGSKHK